MSPQGYTGNNNKKKHVSHPSDSFQLTGMWEELSSGMSPPSGKSRKYCHVTWLGVHRPGSDNLLGFVTLGKLISFFLVVGGGW